MSEDKELSILIPVYNQDVRPLVKSLIQQGTELQLSFEIRCFDDFSSAAIRSLNSELKNLSNVIYKDLDHNIGRSKIRNKLAEEAQFNLLLFLDCDSQVKDNSFLKKYMDHASEELVVGGREYTEVCPSGEFILHWKSGKAKEEKSALKRSLNPFSSFMSNNFLIKKNIYLSIKMDESLQGYGHEDSKFGYDLQNKNIKILHIENPIIHASLDNSKVFLSKTKEGIKNFYQITKEGYSKNTKLYRSYYIIKKLKLNGLFNHFYNFLKNKIEKNLLSTNPSLFYFDLFKLKNLLDQEN